MVCRVWRFSAENRRRDSSDENRQTDGRQRVHCGPKVAKHSLTTVSATRNLVYYRDERSCFFWYIGIQTKTVNRAQKEPEGVNTWLAKYKPKLSQTTRRQTEARVVKYSLELFWYWNFVYLDDGWYLTAIQTDCPTWQFNCQFGAKLTNRTVLTSVIFGVSNRHPTWEKLKRLALKISTCNRHSL